MAAEDRPDFKQGDDVIVAEDGIHPWGGKVRSIKWSSTSGWWIEVLRPDDSVLVAHVSKVSKGGEVSVVAP